MTAITFVRITLDDSVPEYMAGIIRCGAVISEDENGNTINDHQELIDNAEFHSKSELIASVAQRLGVSGSIVEIAS